MKNMKKILSVLLVMLLLLSGCRAEQPDIDSGEESELIPLKTEIVRFWETVDEMSMEEAKNVYGAMMQRIRNEEYIASPTDEERMAMYVLGCGYHEDYMKKYDYNVGDGWPIFSIKLILEGTFEGGVKKYLEKQWTSNTWKVKYDYRGDGEHRILVSAGGAYHVLYGIEEFWLYLNNIEVTISFCPKQTTRYKYGEVTTFHKELLRYYLSLKSVVYSGPIRFYGGEGNIADGDV